MRPATWRRATGGSTARVTRTARRPARRTSLALVLLAAPALTFAGSDSPALAVTSALDAHLARSVKADTSKHASDALSVPESATAAAERAAKAGVVPLHFDEPSWWDGPCDANHWDPVADADGWDGAGAHPMGASYLGIEVCGPRPAVDGAPDVQWNDSGWPELEWECVELAMRFMTIVYGVHAYSANGNDVVSNYSPSDGGGLVAIQNGTPDEAPQPGDIMSFSDGGEGHVVVVASSDVDAYGNGSITVLSQNDTNDGWRTLAVDDWWVQGFNIFTPTAWLHDPLGRGNPAAPPTVMNPGMPAAAVGLEYRAGLYAVGGSPHYTWSLASGRLPAGLTLDPATGVISGVPSSTGAVRFTVRVTSATMASSIRSYTLTVRHGSPLLDGLDFSDDLGVG